MLRGEGMERGDDMLRGGGDDDDKGGRGESGGDRGDGSVRGDDMERTRGDDKARSESGDSGGDETATVGTSSGGSAGSDGGRRAGMSLSERDSGHAARGDEMPGDDEADEVDVASEDVSSTARGLDMCVCVCVCEREGQQQEGRARKEQRPLPSSASSLVSAAAAAVQRRRLGGVGARDSYLRAFGANSTKQLLRDTQTPNPKPQIPPNPQQRDRGHADAASVLVSRRYCGCASVKPPASAPPQ